MACGVTYSACSVVLCDMASILETFATMQGLTEALCKYLCAPLSKYVLLLSAAFGWHGGGWLGYEGEEGGGSV
jgi:hypothetical protein